MLSSGKVWMFIAVMIVLMVVCSVASAAVAGWILPASYTIGDIVAGQQNIVYVSTAQFETLKRPSHISARSNGCPTIRCVVKVDGLHSDKNVRVSTAVTTRLDAVKGDEILLGEIIKLR